MGIHFIFIYKYTYICSEISFSFEIHLATRWSIPLSITSRNPLVKSDALTILFLPIANMKQLKHKNDKWNLWPNKWINYMSNGYFSVFIFRMHFLIISFWWKQMCIWKITDDIASQWHNISMALLQKKLFIRVFWIPSFL